MHQFAFCVLQVKLHCQVRGDLMAELWQNLCCLTSASLTAGKAAGAKSAACAAANEALWAAMPAVQDAYMRCDYFSDLVKSLMI